MFAIQDANRKPCPAADRANKLDLQQQKAKGLFKTAHSERVHPPTPLKLQLQRVHHRVYKQNPSTLVSCGCCSNFGTQVLRRRACTAPSMSYCSTVPQHPSNSAIFSCHWIASSNFITNATSVALYAWHEPVCDCRCCQDRNNNSSILAIPTLLPLVKKCRHTSGNTCKKMPPYLRQHRIAEVTSAVGRKLCINNPRKAHQQYRCQRRPQTLKDDRP